MLTIIPMLLFSSICIVFLLYFQIKDTVIKDKINTSSNIGYYMIDSKYTGDWVVVDGKLYKGTTLINGNYSIVDEIKNKTESLATIFLNDTRITTNVLKEDGTRAVGTTAPQEVVNSVLKQGNTYEGVLNLLGKDYFTKYIPIKNNSGKILGMFFVGIEKSYVYSIITPLIYKISVFMLIIIVISSFVILLIVNRIHKNVNKVVELSKRVGKGDLTNISQNSQLRKCWEVMKCNKKECPAYNNSNLMCWQISGTLCNDEIQGDMLSKLQLCENCNVYNKASGDELGEISLSVNNMIKSLDDIIKEIKDASTKIDSSSVNVSNSINELSTSMETIEKTTTELAKGISIQAQNVQISVEKLENLSSMIDIVINNSKEISKCIGEVVSVSNDGQNVVTELNEVVKENINISNLLDGQVNVLENKSKLIDSVTETIKSIANETKLLALNAMIESARAGESGRGFSVVADHIGKLAEQVSNNTKEIELTIKDIKQETNNTREKIMLEKDVIKSMKDISYLTKQRFESISSAISKTIKLLETLLNSIEEVSQNKDKIINDIQEISTITEQSAAATEEISASVHEETNTVIQISKITIELRQIVSDLNKVINSFLL